MKKIQFVAAVFCLFLVNVMPVSAYDAASLPKVVDNAGLLTVAEEAELTEKINSISEKYQMDVVLYTQSKKQDADIQNEADLLFDNNGYGIGATKDGMLFLLSMQEREWAISTHGKTIDMFTTYELNKMGQDSAQNYFSKGLYKDGFNNFLSTLGGTIDREEGLAEQGNAEANSEANAEANPEANAAGNVDAADEDTAKTDQNAKDQTQDSSAAFAEEQEQEEEYEDEEKTPVDYIIPALICGLIITLIIMWRMKKKMKTAYAQDNADVYKSKDIATKIYKNEEYLTSRTTKKRLEKNEPKKSGSQGGTHTSSNGERHGGASGKF